MRVLMTIDAVGGVWTYASDLATGLARRGDAVTLAVLGPATSDAQRQAVQSVHGLELVETDLPLDWTATDESDLARSAEGLRALAAKARPHVIHLNSPALAGASRLGAPVVGVAHSCLATWWSAVKGDDPPGDFGWRIAATARGYAACDALISPSAAFAAATEAAYGVSPLVVRNGRAASVETSAVRDIPVVTTGRLWDEGKDAATLDAAAARLDDPVMALGPTRGPGGEGGTFIALRTPGAQSSADVAAVLARSCVFVSSARYEPFGLSVLEAAQAGCALVLSDIPTFRELWEGAAAFAPPGDASAFAAAIRALLADDVQREHLAAAARIRSDRYGLDAMVEGTAAVHRAVLRSTGEVGA